MYHEFFALLLALLLTLYALLKLCNKRLSERHVTTLATVRVTPMDSATDAPPVSKSTPSESAHDAKHAGGREGEPPLATYSELLGKGLL